MRLFLAISAWCWSWITIRLFIWPYNYSGITWIPRLNANSWYRLTDIKYRIKFWLLPFFYIYSHLVNIVVIINYVVNKTDDFYFIFVFIIHNLKIFWWPAFFELQSSWLKTFVVIVCILLLKLFITFFHIDFTLILNFFDLIIISWLLIINWYCWKIIKTPVINIEYRPRSSRTLEV